MNRGCVEFVVRSLTATDVRGRKALDVRDRDVMVFRALYRVRVVAARVLPRGVRRALKALVHVLPARHESH